MQNFILTILLILCSAPVLAQVAAQKYEVGQLRFKGNETLNDDQLLNVMNTRETPWVVWKWIYHLFDKEILGGQKPEYFDPVTFLLTFIKSNDFIKTTVLFILKLIQASMFYPEKKWCISPFQLKRGDGH